MSGTKKDLSANTEYMSNGVAISPAFPSIGDNVTVTYDGLLSKSGASAIQVHVGFGSVWDNQETYPMTRSSTGFVATISVKSADTLNLCFKDYEDHWDNNSGKNYSFDIY
ncbi:MAG: carbohydrate-binding protein [Clostridia bacterium]|nr:carbohydrate-binding protein [Clostridia bacterium]